MKYLDRDGLAFVLEKLRLRLNGKVDAEEGKGLSRNDFTDAFREKLENLSFAQADWEETDPESPAFILHKPFGRSMQRILPETTVSGLPAEVGGDTEGITEDSLLIICFDGKEYPCEAQLGEADTLIFGNPAWLTGNVGEEGEPPFCLIVGKNAMTVYGTEPEEEHTLEVRLLEQEKLSAEWLDEESFLIFLNAMLPASPEAMRYAGMVEIRDELPDNAVKGDMLLVREEHATALYTGEEWVLLTSDSLSRSEIDQAFEEAKEEG